MGGFRAGITKKNYVEPAKSYFARRKRSTPNMKEMLKGLRNQLEGTALVSSRTSGTSK